MRITRLPQRTSGAASHAGFTLIELLVVMSIIALLLTIALPRYFGAVDKAKEVALKENLQVLRTTLDKFYADKGRYPANLDELVAQRYIRAVPPDPVTGSSATWLILPPPDGASQDGVANVRSGAPGQARDGGNYADF